jgi:hypothetical protein
MRLPKGLVLACAAAALAIAPSRCAGQWLPLPVEEIESPERLDEEDSATTSWLIRAKIRDGALALHRAEGSLGWRGFDLGLSVGGPVPELRTSTLLARWERPGLDLTGGRVAARASGSLFAEAIGLTNRAGRVPVAHAELPTLEAPAGVSSPQVEGGAFRLVSPWGSGAGSGARSFLPALWGLAGCGTEDGAQIAAAGLVATAPSGSARFGVSVGSRDGVTAIAAAAERTGGGMALAAEGAVRRGSGAALLSLEASRSALRLSGRWRYRSTDTRPVSSELTAATGTRHASARIRMSGTPSGSYGAAERVELESRYASRDGPSLALRMGRVSTSGFSELSGARLRRERYAVLDATIARVEGRTLSLVASRRARQTDQGDRVGSTLGGRLELALRRRARLMVLVEAVRADLAGGAAWGTGLYAGGSTALRTRTRSGVFSSARGSLRIGRWEIGGVFENREDERGRNVAAAMVSLERLPRRRAH